MDLAHTFLITVHTTAAALAFAFGLVVFVRIPLSNSARPFVLYAACVWIAVSALAAVVILDWPHLNLPRRIAFSALGVLGLYLLWRTERARRTLRLRTVGWRHAFIGHVGFVLISLFDGFCIVLAIDLRMPAWVVIGAALFGVAAGVLAIRTRAKRERLFEAKNAPA